MAEVSKNNKILKFEVSARFDKKNDQVSIFATDHDFAGLPFKVNILNTSNTHKSILSVMKDYEMEVSEDLIDKDERLNDSIPTKVDYPKQALSAEGLTPLGMGENNSLVHIELPDFLIVEGSRESGRIQLLNTLIQGGENDGYLSYYVNDLQSLKLMNKELFRLSRENLSKRLLVVSDGFKGINFSGRNSTRHDLTMQLMHELEVMSVLVFSLSDAHAILSVQKDFNGFVSGFSDRGLNVKTISMGNSPDDNSGSPISGRAYAEGLFVNGEKIDELTAVQVYSTQENKLEYISESGNMLNAIKIIDQRHHGHMIWVKDNGSNRAKG